MNNVENLHSRRLRRVAVNFNDITSMLNWYSRPKGTEIEIRCCEKLPDDVEVVSVENDCSSRSLFLVLRHSSFAEIGANEPMPWHGDGSGRFKTLIKD